MEYSNQSRDNIELVLQNQATENGDNREVEIEKKKEEETQPQTQLQKEHTLDTTTTTMDIENLLRPEERCVYISFPYFFIPFHFSFLFFVYI